MEKNKKIKKIQEPVLIPHQIPRTSNPSFSSTLLESIYRSIDEPGADKPEPLEDIMSMSFYHSMRKDHKFSKPPMLSNSNSNSSSSSSESGFWSGGLSSSDSESAHFYYGPKSKSKSKSSSSSSSSSSCYSMQRPKPIRTERSRSQNHQNEDHKAKMMSTIYNELKKVKKQPISPGGKLSSFLNSLFSHPKKPKNPKPLKLGFEDPITVSKSSSSYVSTPNCSSASSYTRSCLSKNPSLKLSSTGSKRSVRFFPVSVIVDEDSQPCGQKKLTHEDEDDLKVVRVMEETRKVRKLLESYRKSKKEISVELSDDDDDDEEDDDAMSCSSSDLFELNNLSDIGTGRYSEELPVYETTHVDTNRAIANGFIV